jgi:glycosyltransferase involved in cell wall biosynthesis
MLHARAEPRRLIKSDEHYSKVPVTVVVPTKNEALNLPHCLDRLRGKFAEVLVVDSGSTDGTVRVAEEYGARVVEFRWDGRFPKKRNWCLLNYEFKTEWVLFLDADEYVTEEFVDELRVVLCDDRFNGYWVTYRNYFMGRLLRHGDRMRKLPLLRVGNGEFERVEEDCWSPLDMEVHEHLIVGGAVGRMKSPLIHNDFKSLAAYYDRHNSYSSWEAERYDRLKKEASSDRILTRRQRLKYGLLNSSLFPLAYFFTSYVIRLGFLDGAEGLRFNLSKMFYFYQVNFKIAEKCRRSDY